MTIASVRIQKIAEFPTEVKFFRKEDGRWKILATLEPSERWIIDLRWYLFRSREWTVSPLIWATNECVQVDFEYVGGKTND